MVRVRKSRRFISVGQSRRFLLRVAPWARLSLANTRTGAWSLLRWWENDKTARRFSTAWTVLMAGRCGPV